ncbi:uncharacterized protein Bfra_009089 [Botrytis fragariae]|uniref:Uncharacterized protein n=1 Tax=Botrytis fragariae TaxID=1964551 RepID=A0A8H6AR46_9HELO|nr:uncharacterized protein Bfra_009089 [Botrytis fragariae]KAF5872061.1 hypothetical protein Bfra_009089 [Botrytis fragariae]
MKGYIELFKKSKIEEYKESIKARVGREDNHKIIDQADNAMNLTLLGERLIDISEKPRNKGERSQFKDRISQLSIFIKVKEGMIYLPGKKLLTSQNDTEATVAGTGYLFWESQVIVTQSWCICLGFWFSGFLRCLLTCW